MIIFLTIIMGLMIGSFLNVCIYRMPKEKSIVKPRSFCPHCKHTIAWYHNIPVISFLVLGGKCAFCKKKISPRYLIVEVLTAAIFVLLINTLGLHITTIIFIVLCCGLIVATFIDFQYQIIPDEITYGGMVLGLILSFSFPQLHGAIDRLCALRDSFIGLLVGGAMIYAIAQLGGILFRKKLKAIGEENAMGGGDLKLLAMIGAFMGFKQVIFIFFLAPFFGSIIGIIMKFKYKKDIIPYGPYLAIASLVSIVRGKEILNFIFPYF